MRFQMPWMREPLSHLMYHESGYRCSTSLEMVEMGRRRAAPADTAREKAQMAKETL